MLSSGWPNTEDSRDADRCDSTRFMIGLTFVIPSATPRGCYATEQGAGWEEIPRVPLPARSLVRHAKPCSMLPADGQKNVRRPDWSRPRVSGIRRRTNHRSEIAVRRKHTDALGVGKHLTVANAARFACRQTKGCLWSSPVRRGQDGAGGACRRASAQCSAGAVPVEGDEVMAGEFGSANQVQ